MSGRAVASSQTYRRVIADLRQIVQAAPRGSEIHRRCQSALVALQRDQTVLDTPAQDDYNTRTHSAEE